MILTADHMVLGDDASLLEGAGILVGPEGKIERLTPLADMKRLCPDEPLVDYGSATILPGLVDMHVHLGFYYSQPDFHQYDDYMVFAYTMHQAQLALTLGITTVRDMSSPRGVCRQLRLAGQKGYCPVPRIIHSDTGICMSGGHGHGDGIEQVDGPWNLRAAIRRQVRDGADWIKLLTSHRSSIPEFTQEELDAAVDECHRRGIKTAVHAGTQPSVEMCIQAGFDTIEHGTFLTVQQAEDMKRQGLAWTPTMYAYTYLYQATDALARQSGRPANPTETTEMAGMHFYRPAYEAYRDNFKQLYNTGVCVLAGSDMVMYGAPPLPVAKELALMVEYGITPLQAIQTATQNPARVLGLDKEIGLLREGLRADVLVVEGNAAQDIACLENVAAVYQNGTLVHTKAGQPQA